MNTHWIPLIAGTGGHRAGGGSSTPDPVPLLFIFRGESNAGGKAPNADATAPELAARPAVQILDNSTLLLADLKIGHPGSNNLTGHIQLDGNDEHGMENQLGHWIENGDLGSRTVVYLCKTGQGGSTIPAWAIGVTTGYNAYATAQTRMAAAISEIQSATGQLPQVIMIQTIGINDGQTYQNSGNNPASSSSPANYKTALKQDIANYRADLLALGITQVPVMFLNFQFVDGSGTFGGAQDMAPYTTKVSEIPGEVSDFFAIDTTGLTTLDGLHLDYQSIKDAFDLAMNTYLANYSI